MKKYPPPYRRLCCEHSAHPRPLCWTWDAIAEVGIETKANIRRGDGSESNREKHRGSHGCRTQSSCQPCNRQDFLLTGEVALRESVLPTGGKVGGHLQGALKLDSCPGEDFWVDIPQWGRFWGHFYSKHWLCDQEASCPRASVDMWHGDLGGTSRQAEGCYFPHVVVSLFNEQTCSLSTYWHLLGECPTFILSLFV